MNAKSHQILGNYLVKKYMYHLPKRYIRAFLIGCVQPDRNPTTYLKGSFRSRWLRGHNWNNAQRFMGRICKRLENRDHFGILDYYSLGKLIHYTTDSFTYAHNDHFKENLRQHQTYEKSLYKYFIRYLPDHKQISMNHKDMLMADIRAYHNDYLSKPAGVYNDAKYAINACSMVMARLIPDPMDEITESRPVKMT